MEHNSFLVSTICFTYNHAPFIVDTLNGFLMQETSFPAVFIVIEDASVDGEPTVIRQWVKNNLEPKGEGTIWQHKSYGDIAVARLAGKEQLTFVILLLAENHYSVEKKQLKLEYVSEWNDARYIALCEGDDYWTDPLKLQKQLDYMETHPDCALTHTGFLLLEGDKLKKCANLYEMEAILESNKEDAALRPYILDHNRYRIQTMTVVMRYECYRNARSDLSDLNGKFLMSDTQLWVSILTYGKIHYFPEIMAVYRLHANSSTHQPSREGEIRFELSCADMRVVMADRYGIDKGIRNTFRRQFIFALIMYSWYKGHYEPVARLNYSFLEDTILRINKIPMVMFIARKAYGLKIKLTSLIRGIFRGNTQ